MALKTRTVLIALGTLFTAASVAVTAVVTAGASRPVAHELTVTTITEASCEATWAAAADLQSQAAWRDDLAAVRGMPDRLGRTAWMEFYSHGERMVVSEVEVAPPTRLVWRLDDDTGPFEADWVFAFVPAGEGCSVSLTEHGRSRNPMFRFVLHYLVGEAAYPTRYLEELTVHMAISASE